MNRRDPIAARWLLRLGVLPLTIACADLSEKSTPTALCVSGERWTGDDMGHPEMHPGRDCLGCHEENDGPPLVLGGTVYGPDAPQEADCFGVEGVVVRITAADGELIELETNRAGNFYLEGDPSTFAKPFQAQIEGPDFLGNPQPPRMMINRPETGDCGHCHSDVVPDPTTLALDQLDRYFPVVRINLGHALTDYGFAATP